MRRPSQIQRNSRVSFGGSVLTIAAAVYVAKSAERCAGVVVTPMDAAQCCVVVAEFEYRGPAIPEALVQEAPAPRSAAVLSHPHRDGRTGIPAIGGRSLLAVLHTDPEWIRHAQSEGEQILFPPAQERPLCAVPDRL